MGGAISSGGAGSLVSVTISMLSSAGGALSGGASTVLPEVELAML